MKLQYQLILFKNIQNRIALMEAYHGVLQNPPAIQRIKFFNLNTFVMLTTIPNFSSICFYVL